MPLEWEGWNINISSSKQRKIGNARVGEECSVMILIFMNLYNHFFHIFMSKSSEILNLASWRFLLWNVIIFYNMIRWWIIYCLCISLSAPPNTISSNVHFEVGYELPIGLGQNVAVLNELLPSHDEGGYCVFQVHLHPQLCPILQHSTSGCPSQFPFCTIQDSTL